MTLSQVLFAVQQRTGAEVSIAAGAEQETVAVDLTPGPAPEVLARLLNGSKFNFLILSAANDPQRLDRVILSPRAEGGIMPAPAIEVQNDAPADNDASPEPGAQSINTAPIQNPPGAAPEMKSRDDENTPPQ